MEIHRRTKLVDGLVTSYLEAGEGDPVVLLHGGEFGASAELGWERTIPALAGHYRVLAPDMLGYGRTAKVLDFVDGRGMRIRHVAAFCAALGIDSALFVGNSMGAINLLVDATSEAMRGIVEALFHDPSYPADDAYVQRRHESATLPGAWEAIAAARFRRPGAQPAAAAASGRPYHRVSVPTLVIEGGSDK